MSRYLQSYIKDYERYRLMSGITVGMSVTNLVNNNIPGSVFTIIYAILLMAISNNAKKQSKNAYEFQLLNGLYKDILEEVAKSITKLELGDIEGIFTYVCYLYKNNYLSYDRNLPIINRIPIFNEEAVLASLSLNNHGVCRHKAPMLVDLYKLFDIEAYGLTGTYFQNNRIIVADDSIMNEEEIRGIIGDGEVKPEQIFKVLEEISKRIETRLNTEREFLNSLPTGNHAITQANSQDHTYLLDPTHKEFYVEADEEGRFYSNNGNYFKIVSVKKKKHLYKDHLNMKIIDKKPIMEMDEMNDIMNKYLKRIEDNQDIVEEMHSDIEPMLLLADDTYKMILQAR